MNRVNVRWIVSTCFVKYKNMIFIYWFVNRLFFCNKYKPFQTLYIINIVLKLEWPIHVQRFFFLLQAARRKEFRCIINWEILLGPDDTRIFHIFLTTKRNFNEIERSILLIMIICKILMFLFIYLNLGIKSKSFKYRLKDK